MRIRGLILLVLFLLLGIPLALPLVDLLYKPSSWDAWSETRRILGLLRTTALLSLATLMLTLPLGVVTAFLVYRTDVPLARLLRFLVILALFVPLPLLASGWQAALGSGGWLPLRVWSPAPEGDPDVSPTGIVWKAWGRGLNAAVWIHAIAALPWVILLVGVGLRWVERDLEEEALLVTGPWTVLRRVTLRRSAAAIAAAGLWVILQVATEISVTDMFQVRTFAEEVYTQLVIPDITEDGAAPAVDRAVAIALPSVLATWLIVVLGTRMWEKHLPPLRDYSVSPYLYSLKNWRWPIAIVILLGGLFLAAVPVGSLAWKAGNGDSAPGWSAGALVGHLDRVLRARRVLGIPFGIIVSSLGHAILSGLATGILAWSACWAARASRTSRWIVLGLTALTWAYPGPLVGLGLKTTINHLLDLTSSSWLAGLLYHGPSPLPVIWAHLIRFFPCAVAILWPVMRLLPRDLSEEAHSAGGAFGEMRHVAWPLTLPALGLASLAVGVLSLGELSAGKLVETPGLPTFAHEVFTQMHYGVTADLAALCLWLLMIVALGALLVRRFTES